MSQPAQMPAPAPMPAPPVAAAVAPSTPVAGMPASAPAPQTGLLENYGISGGVPVTAAPAKPMFDLGGLIGGIFGNLAGRPAPATQPAAPPAPGAGPMMVPAPTAADHAAAATADQIARYGNGQPVPAAYGTPSAAAAASRAAPTSAPAPAAVVHPLDEIASQFPGISYKDAMAIYTARANPTLGQNQSQNIALSRQYAIANYNAHPNDPQAYQELQKALLAGGAPTNNQQMDALGQLLGGLKK